MKTYNELFQALINKDTFTIEQALKNGFNPNTTDKYGFSLAHRACTNNNIEILQLLIDHRSKINIQATDNWTPLHLASVSGCIKCISILYNNGANMNAIDIIGNSALHLSIISENPEISKELIKYGCNKKLKNNKGLIALESAKNRKLKQFYKILMI